MNFLQQRFVVGIKLHARRPVIVKLLLLDAAISDSIEHFVEAYFYIIGPSERTLNVHQGATLIEQVVTLRFSQCTIYSWNVLCFSKISAQFLATWNDIQEIFGNVFEIRHVFGRDLLSVFGAPLEA